MERGDSRSSNSRFECCGGNDSRNFLQPYRGLPILCRQESRRRVPQLSELNCWMSGVACRVCPSPERGTQGPLPRAVGAGQRFSEFPSSTQTAASLLSPGTSVGESANPSSELNGWKSGVPCRVMPHRPEVEFDGSTAKRQCRGLRILGISYGVNQNPWTALSAQDGAEILGILGREF